MNKRVLISAVSVLSIAMVAGIIVGSISSRDKTQSIYADGYVPSLTKVDITSISNLQNLASIGLDEYYSFSASGLSPRGATINLQEFDQDSFGGSYIYSETSNGIDTTDPNYMFKLVYHEGVEYAPYAYFCVLIHEMANLNLDNSYVQYDLLYNNYPGTQDKFYQKGELTEYDIVEIGGNDYMVYRSNLQNYDYREGNAIGFSKIHLEYDC